MAVAMFILYWPLLEEELYVKLKENTKILKIKRSDFFCTK